MKTLHFIELDSTNNYLKENYEKLDDFTFVSCDYQTAGKGRENRKWQSNKKENLLFSVLLKDKKYLDKYSALSMLSAYCLVEILNKYHLDAKIKWPNDVYVNDKKIAGILLEAISINTIKCLIIGIGLNINQEKFEIDLVHPATSFFLELNKKIDISSLKKELFVTIEKNFRDFSDGKDFYNEIIKYDYLKGKEVYANINNKKEKVEIIGINKDYSIKVKINNKEINLVSGEISFHI